MCPEYTDIDKHLKDAEDKVLKELLADANKYFSNNDFKNALDNFTDALTLRPSCAEAKTGKAKASEAHQKAVQ